MIKDYGLAKKYFYSKDYKKARYEFLKLNSLYEVGLCDFLSGDFQSAKSCWKNCNDDLFASQWGLIALDLISNKEPDEKPKYFQIRAFYEIYISLLIENGFYQYAENLIKSYQYLTYYNLEVPKFIARVLHAYNYDDGALNFVNISLSENFVDIEAAYIAAQIYFSRKDYDKTQEFIDKITEIAPSYYPALQLQQKIPN